MNARPGLNFRSLIVATFKNISFICGARRCSTSTKANLSIQQEFMDKDMCIVVDKCDKVQSVASKKDCHHGSGLLHRAFSLFLFRDSPLKPGSLQLLLQKRSASKLTFPLLWSNSCCSHPCVNYDGETEEDYAMGVKRAARRKVQDELGLDIAAYSTLDNIHFLARFIYSAPNEPPDVWCENEVDYCLVSIIPSRLSNDLSFDARIIPNLNEVAAISWTDFDSLESLIKTDPRNFTPWFRKLLFSGYLKMIWQWAEAKASSSAQFFHDIDKSWDRNIIFDLK